MKSSPYDWNFTSINDGISSQSLKGGIQRQPRGKMLGGSGSLNNMVYARGFPADYDEWSTIAGSTWSWDNVLEYFKRTEYMSDAKIVNNPELMKYHSRRGEIEVTGNKEVIHETDVFMKAFGEIGFDIVDDMTYPEKVGVGRFSHTVRDGQRDSSLTALLNKAKGSNISVFKNALVTKILIENSSAVGVKVVSEGHEYRYYATKEVIVSAGTFNTAKLLMLSGVGPEAHLQNLGINVISDLPVGDNLHDHVMYLNFIEARNGTCDYDLPMQHMNLIQYLYDRSGMLANSDSMGALLVLNGSKPNTPDFAFYPTCTPRKIGFYDGCVNMLGFTDENCKILDDINQHKELIAVAVVLLKPKSRGSVRLNSTDPLDDPIIYSGTFNDNEDLENYPQAINIVRSFLNTEYLKQKSATLVNFKVKECEGLSGDEEVKCKARSMATSAWHAVGTAAMGDVVDGKLRVLGVRALRVVDASVMPKVPRGNTNAPVVMIAEKAADFIKQAYGAE